MVTMSIVRIAIRVDSRPVVYLFGTRVRSWQKALAGAARRIRCHSHPRMLLHSEPRALCIALILSLGLSLSLRSLPRPSLDPFSCTHLTSRSLSAPRFLFCLNAFSFRFQPSLSLLFIPFVDHGLSPLLFRFKGTCFAAPGYSINQLMWEIS